MFNFKRKRFSYGRKKQKKSKLFLEAILGVCIVALLAFNALLIWVATGTRSLTMLTPYIEQAFQTPDSNFSVKIGETVMLWDGWRHPIDIRLHDVSILTKNGVVFSNFPDIALGVDVFSLPFGRILPTSITITHPVISLLQNEDRTLSFGFKPQARTETKPEEKPAEKPAETPEAAASAPLALPVAMLLGPLLNNDGTSNLRKLRFISVSGASISVGSTQKGILLESSDTDITMEKNRHGIVQISATSTVNYDKYHAPIKAQFLMGKEMPTIDGNVEFRELHPSAIAPLMSGTALPLMTNMPISGNLTVSMEPGGKLQRLGFIIDAGKGSVHSDKLAKDIDVDALHAEGDLSNDGNDLSIKTLAADIGGMPLTVSGTVVGMHGDTAIDGLASIHNVPASKVAVFWPPSLAPITRDWVISSITDGAIEEASVRVKVAAGDLAKPALPKEDIDANVILANAKIRYVAEHPPLQHVSAKVHIDGLALDATLTSASFMDATKLSNGHVLIEDLNPDNPYIKTSGDMETTAKEAVRILGLPRIAQADRLNLNSDKTSGKVKGNVQLGFYFFARHDKYGKSLADEDLSYKLSLDLQDISTQGLLTKYDVKNINGTLEADDKAIIFKGKGNVNDATILDATVKYLSKAENGYDTFIDATGGTQMVNLPRFGITVPKGFSNLLGFKVGVKQGHELESYEASLNLTETAINQPSLGWLKAEKIPAKLNLSADKVGTDYNISKFELASAGANAKGAALVGNDGKLRRLALENFAIGKSDIDTLNYDTTQDAKNITIKGRSADLSGWMKGDDNNFSFEHFPAMQFTADVGRLIFGEGKQIDAFKGDLHCDVKICDKASFSGTTGAASKPFALRIMRNPKGRRQFSLHGEDAGSLFKALDVMDGMEGGDLSITGNYDDNGAHSVLRGKMDITAYTMKDAPILAKILSLASLSGFLDTLQGNGIAFKRFTAPFTLTNDVITLEKAKTYGSAMGMTADGTVTMPAVAFNITGTVVPSYSLNTSLGSVPVVGKLLTGGEGQGVFAARYSVGGTEKKPDVSVNPLSILTPGFLRGLFDIFDSSDTKEKTESEPESTPAAASADELKSTPARR